MAENTKVEGFKKTPEMKKVFTKMRGMDKSAIARYAFFTDNGKAIINDNRYCHAQMTAGNSVVRLTKGASFIEFILESYHKAEEIYLDKKHVIAYIDWLANRSVWSPAFLTKDAEEIYSEGAVLTTDVPMCVLAGACIAGRAIWEWAPSVLIFSSLVESGVKEPLAFFISHLYGPGERQNYNPLKTFVKQTLEGNHSVFDLGKFSNKGNFKRLIENTPTIAALKERTYRESSTYHMTVTKIFGEGTGDREKIYSILRGLKKDFDKVRENAWGGIYETSLENIVEVVSKNQDEIIKKMLED